MSPILKEPAVRRAVFPVSIDFYHERGRLIASILKPGQIMLREDPITTSRSEPDLAVVEGREEDFYERQPQSALRAVEIAVSSVEFDLRKAAIYVGAGVAEYWPVEPEARCAPVFHQPDGDAYLETEQFTGIAVLECQVWPAWCVNLKDLLVT